MKYIFSMYILTSRVSQCFVILFLYEFGQRPIICQTFFYECEFLGNKLQISFCALWTKIGDHLNWLTYQ